MSPVAAGRLDGARSCRGSKTLAGTRSTMPGQEPSAQANAECLGQLRKRFCLIQSCHSWSTLCLSRAQCRPLKRLGPQRCLGAACALPLHVACCMLQVQGQGRSRLGG